MRILSLSNSTDIVVNSISVINGGVVENIKDPFLSKEEALWAHQQLIESHE